MVRRPIAFLGVVLVTLLVLVVAGAHRARAAAPARASHRAEPPCSSYPAPGTLAPAGTRLPAWLTRRYAVLGSPQRRVDRVSSAQLGPSLTASGLVLSHSRFLGTAAFGGRIYLVPAEHLLAFPLAPARCLPPAERSLEAELAPQLRRQYVHWALCIVVLHSVSDSPTCGAADADPDALLYAAGTPGFGLVRNGVRDVTVSYLTAPKRTVRVRDNFFVVDDPSQSAAPCAAQWETTSGNVTRSIAGCDYAQMLQGPLDEYRTYVQSTLATLGSQVSTLLSAIQGGNLAVAQADWLTAHETWLDIGQDDGAYSAFGELGSELDGTSAGLPQGTADPGFTGFHRVELDLFQTGDLAAAATDTTTLGSILSQIVDTPLGTAFPDTNNGIANWVLRPHETLEDAIRDTLSGDDDYGSGTGLASVSADVTATREFLTVLEPVLSPLAPGLISTARAELTMLADACIATQVNGQWVAVSALSARQREAIDADAGAAAETLARVPDVLTNVGTGAPTI